MNLISNLPPKGTADWLPAEFAQRKYIFDTWRKVCLSFGYQEYLTPVIEAAEVYRAKSGEEVGGVELMTMTDRAGRELAIRPEMTPSVTRMVSRIYESSPKPIRLFSIANFLRNQKPQRGRNREFWQLNADVFGSSNIESDIEVLTLALEIMRAFKAPTGSYILRINHRTVVNEFLNTTLQLQPQQQKGTLVVMDRWMKLSNAEVDAELNKIGLNNSQQSQVRVFMNNGIEVLANSNSEAAKELLNIATTLEKLGYSNEFKVDPTIVRGLDYYDGMVFEMFDTNPENTRSLFGGGRYNGLANIFGSSSFPAVGFAPGDETTKLFLEANNLFPVDIQIKPEYFIPAINPDSAAVAQLAQRLRNNGKRVVIGYEQQQLGKGIEFALKNDFKFVVIYGEDEADKGIYKLKNLESREEQEISL